MIKSAIRPSRSINIFVIFVFVVLTFLGLISLAGQVYYSNKQKNTINKLDKSISVYKELLKAARSEEGVDVDDELSEKAQGIMKSFDGSIYNPVYLLSLLESYKSDGMMFSELTFEREKRNFQGVIVSRNYSEIVSFLKRVEQDSNFSSAQLRKKGRSSSEGVTYQVQLDIGELENI